MSFLETRIPPPVVMLFFATVIWWQADLTQIPLIPGYHSLFWPAVLVFGTGALFDLISLKHFLKAKTTINPLSPEKASQLVSTGIYAFTRNPMYVGLLLWLLAICLHLNTLFGLLAPLGFVAYINRFQIQPEEKYLQQLFGESYLSYKQQVPRWLIIK